MEGNGTAWVLGQMLGGTIAVLAIVGALAVIGAVWVFRRLWLFLRLELMIDARKAQLNELAGQIETANVELSNVKMQVQAFQRRLPPIEVPHGVVSISKNKF
jgi:hypothetical protein